MEDMVKSYSRRKMRNDDDEDMNNVSSASNAWSGECGQRRRGLHLKSKSPFCTEYFRGSVFNPYDGVIGRALLSAAFAPISSSVTYPSDLISTV